MKKEEKKEIKKPLTVMLEDSRKEIIEAINKVSNENGLSFFFLKQIVEPIYQEILQQAELERQRERESYENALKESESVEYNG